MRAAAKPPARNVAANAANANNDPQANNDPPPQAPAQGGQGALDAAALAAAGLGEIIPIPLPPANANLNPLQNINLNLLLPIPPFAPLPLVPNLNPFSVAEFPAHMLWVLSFLGMVLSQVDLMHRLAASCHEANCFHFLQIVYAFPEGILPPAHHASLLVNTERISTCWDTNGVPRQNAPPVNNIIMPPVAVHVPSELASARHIFHATAGRLDSVMHDLQLTAHNQGNHAVVLEHLKSIVEMRNNHALSDLSKSMIIELSSGAFFSTDGVTPSSIMNFRAKRNIRLPPKTMSKMEALVEAISMLKLFVNAPLAKLMTEFLECSRLAMEEHFPDFKVLHIDFVLHFLAISIFPLMHHPSSVAHPVLPAAEAACTAALVRSELLFTLVNLVQKHADGAPTDSRAGQTVGDGGSAPAPVTLPPGEYHRPPAGKTQPAVCTKDPGPCPKPAVMGIELCYAERSSFGRCPYAGCIKQHSWEGVTAAEQAAIKKWLAAWLSKRKWDLFVKWSRVSRGNPTTWPALCN